MTAGHGTVEVGHIFNLIGVVDIDCVDPKPIVAVMARDHSEDVPAEVGIRCLEELIPRPCFIVSRGFCIAAIQRAKIQQP